MKTFIASLSTETNSFSPLPTGMLSFEEAVIAHGDASRGPVQYWSAPMRLWREAAEERGWPVVESLTAHAQPAGPTVRTVYEGFRDEILRDLEAAMPVDVVLLSLHGAMMADGYEDCEGDLIARCRQVVGRDAVIGALLDPHCHLTEAMIEAATLLVAYREYPHVDIPERAQDLFALAADAAEGRTRPVMRDHDCRMICAMHTPREPMRGFVEAMKAREREPGILSLSLAHGFPWGDHPRVGARMLAIADGDAELADSTARAMGDRLFAMRREVAPAYPDIDAALARAAAAPAGPVVLADVSDNAGGGAPSDATFLLEAILARGLTNVASGVYWDPVAVRICREAGEGATLPLRLGGKCGPMSGRPLDLEVTVRRVAEGLTQRFGELSTPLGQTVWLSLAGDIDLVINDQRTQTFHPEAFTGLGIDLAGKAIVCVKSSQHFYAGFAPIAAEVIHVATPGAITPDFANIPYTRRAPNYWPKMEDPFA
ncbi:M81 family metallopeptidase [Aquibium sp. A9E412]|uniref:M81 family metallopeptidase n=1 Tax=Aquibium sp. A9E412 TaxID=2976767 RepID=UPI0025AF1E66|nr:M81 family metallopeptidase [Aquibium sp. A9E412]MDN2565427.1 M81 family metallopeptidase [Aquibium sp. A9E412]